MASTSGSLQTPIFTRKNYEYWSLTMKDLFIGQDVWELKIKNGFHFWFIANSNFYRKEL